MTENSFSFLFSTKRQKGLRNRSIECTVRRLHSLTSIECEGRTVCTNQKACYENSIFADLFVSVDVHPAQNNGLSDD